MGNIYIVNVLFFLNIFLASPLGLEAKTDSLRILFIGNSYTYYHDLPVKVKKIASNIGLDNCVNIAFQMYAPGGYTLKRHLQNKNELLAIKQGKWDYVIIQEQSSAPAKSTEIVCKETYRHARQLDSLIHVHNPYAKVIFYMTWGHKNRCKHKIENYPIIETYEGMQERLKVSYLEMAYTNNAWCAPVGMAWKEMRKEKPSVPLYSDDGTHPSIIGTYLAANVIWATIYQKAYKSAFIVDGLDKELAEYIQGLAQKTVYQNRKLLNLDTVN